MAITSSLQDEILNLKTHDVESRLFDPLTWISSLNNVNRWKIDRKWQFYAITAAILK